MTRRSLHVIDPAVEAERFWAKVDRRGPDDCWPWVAGVGTHGYGAVRFQGKRATSHRVAFFLTYGRWPEPCGLHTCDERYSKRDTSYRRCCNPGHVVEGTQVENLADMVAKGRHGACFGDQNGARRYPERMARRQA